MRRPKAMEAVREFDALREFGRVFGALANQHHDHRRWFRRGTGVATARVPVPC
jgi:hypothetical protein